MQNNKLRDYRCLEESLEKCCSSLFVLSLNIVFKDNTIKQNERGQGLAWFYTNVTRYLSGLFHL